MNNPYSQPQRQAGHAPAASASGNAYSFWPGQNAQQTPNPVSFAPPHVGPPQPVPNPAESSLYANYGYGPQWQRQQQQQPQLQLQQTQFSAPPQSFAFQAPTAVVQPATYSPFQPQIGQQSGFQSSPPASFVQAPPQPYRHPPPGPAAMHFVSIPQPPSQLQPSVSLAASYTQPSRAPPLKRPRHGNPQPPSQPRLHNVPASHRNQHPLHGQGSRSQNVGANQVPIGGRGSGIFAQPMNGNRVPQSMPIRGLPSAPRNKMGRGMAHSHGGGVRNNTGTLAGRMHVRNFNNSNARRSANHFNVGKRQHQTNTRVKDENKDASVVLETTKKDEKRRSLTDFKIVGWCIPELDWRWGSCRYEIRENSLPVDLSLPCKPVVTEGDADTGYTYSASTDKHKEPSGTTSDHPSRLRFYFHTPFEENSSSSNTFSTVSHGKRKKFEDDEEPHERNIRPRQTSLAPSIDMASNGDDGFSHSLEESITATPETDDGDWLMAAIGEETEGEDGSSIIERNIESLVDEGKVASSEPDNADGEPPLTDETWRYVTPVQVITTDPPVPDKSVTPPKEDCGSRASDQSADEDLRVETMVGCLEEPEFSRKTLDHLDPYHSSVEAPHAANANVQSSDLGVNGSASAIACGRTDEGSVATFPSDVNEHTPVNVDTAAAPSSSGISPLSEDVTLENPTELQTSTSYQNPSSHDISSQNVPSSLPNLCESVESQREPVEQLDPCLPREPDMQSDVGHLGKDRVIPKSPSANRLSILYAASQCRLAVDADIVSKIKLFRKEGRFEAQLALEQSTDGVKGLLFEKYTEEQQAFSAVNFSSAVDETDPLVPPLARLTLPSTVTVVIFLDTEKPLSEPGWCKSGNVEEWLKREFGTTLPCSGWGNRIEVVDPDRQLTMIDIIDTWRGRSSFGSVEERERFCKTYMSEPENIYEILLRHIRGERPLPSSSPRAPFSGPLLTALEHSNFGAGQQTHATLAVLATAHLALEYAEKVDTENGRTQAYQRLAEVVQHLPLPSIHRSLDLMFRDWKVSKRGMSTR